MRGIVNMRKFIVVAAATVALAPLAASADAPDKGRVLTSNSTFASLDRNGDHRISRSEAGFDRVLSETFAELDTDGDGFVSPAEYTAAQESRKTVSNIPRQ